MRKVFFLAVFTIGLLASTTMTAQKVNMERYITLAVKNGAAINLDFKAYTPGTPVKIVSGSNIRNITVGTKWYDISFTFTAHSSEMKVYGDVRGFACNDNGEKVSAIDVSHNTQLETLYCYKNQLATLDVSNNKQLKELGCFDNKLTALDISNNMLLRKLSCSYNRLTVLDVSNNMKLKELSCSGNKLTTLDISNNAQLTELGCSYNWLTTLDISNNEHLTELDCSHKTGSLSST